MNLLRTTKLWSRFLALLSALIVYSALCPAICVALAASSPMSATVTHDCCSGTAPQQSPHVQPHTMCCAHHDHLMIASTQSSNGALHAPMLALRALHFYHAFHDAAISNATHAPPFALREQPLYLRNHVFII